MTETLGHSSRYVPDDDELDKYILEIVDPKLTEEEVLTLTAREDKGLTDPLPQQQIDNIEDFKAWQNNFYTFFDRGNKFALGKRRYKSFQRLAALRPELVGTLMDEMEEYNAQSDDDRSAGFNEKLWNDLYEAYGIMSNLVDATDRYALEHGREKAQHFLKR